MPTTPAIRAVIIASVNGFPPKPDYRSFESFFGSNVINELPEEYRVKLRASYHKTQDEYNNAIDAARQLIGNSPNLYAACETALDVLDKHALDNISNEFSKLRATLRNAVTSATPKH